MVLETREPKDAVGCGVHCSQRVDNKHDVQGNCGKWSFDLISDRVETKSWGTKRGEAKDMGGLAAAESCANR